MTIKEKPEGTRRARLTRKGRLELVLAAARKYANAETGDDAGDATDTE